MQTRHRTSARHQERRIHDRAETPQLVELKVGASCFVARLIDLSNSGARLLLPVKVASLRGQPLSITMLDGTESTGLVRWNDGGQLGMEFAIPFLDASELHSFDHLGDDFYRRTFGLQKAFLEQQHSVSRRLQRN